jgi:hypothetical protein
VKSLSLIFFIPAVVLNLAKFLVASALTLSVIPVISAVHLIFKSIRHKMMSLVKNITIHPVSPKDKLQPDLTKQMKLVDLKNFSFEKNIVRPVTTFQSYNLSFHRYYPPESVIYLGVYYAEYSTSFRGSEPTNLEDPDDLRAIIEISTNNWQGILAMLKTNTMWATTNLEDNILINAEDAHNAIEDQIMPALRKREFIKGMSGVSRNNSLIKKFVQSPNYASKLSALIFQFAGFPKHNNLIEKVRLA